MQALKNKALGFSLLLIFSVQVGHAAALKDTSDLKSTEKTSTLVKALDQQKRNVAVIPSTDDELKMLNTIRTTPTQSFFAIQNQRFSRFVQSIFQQQNS